MVLFRYIGPISHYVCVNLCAFRCCFHHFSWGSSQQLHILEMLLLCFQLLWPEREKRLNVSSGLRGEVSGLSIPECALPLHLLLDALNHVNSAGKSSGGR